MKVNATHQRTMMTGMLNAAEMTTVRNPWNPFGQSQTVAVMTWYMLLYGLNGPQPRDGGKLKSVIQ